MKHKIYFSITCLSILLNNLYSQDKDNTYTTFFEWYLSYTCDAGRNFSGGMKAGNIYMGLVNAEIVLHTNKFWKDGEFDIEFMNTHGGNLSGDYIGDLQVASNIENGNYTFIEKLIYRQNFSKLSILFGLQDLNSEFCVSEYGGALTNSSFGIHSTFPLNFGAPLYPKTALALETLYTLNHKFTIRASIFDGHAGSLEDDPHNFDWSVSSEEGLLTVEEIEYRLSTKKPISIKIGGFYHTAEFYYSDGDSLIQKGNFGFYGIYDMLVCEKGSYKAGLFGQMAVFPSKANLNTAYIGVGINLTGILKKREDDHLAAGFAYSRLYDKTYESDLELNYLFAFGSHIEIQPVFHYIICPGANQELKNAFAGFIRLSITK